MVNRAKTTGPETTLRPRPRGTPAPIEDLACAALDQFAEEISRDGVVVTIDEDDSMVHHLIDTADAVSAIRHS